MTGLFGGKPKRNKKRRRRYAGRHLSGEQIVGYCAKIEADPTYILSRLDEAFRDPAIPTWDEAFRVLEDNLEDCEAHVLREAPSNFRMLRTAFDVSLTTAATILALTPGLGQAIVLGSASMESLGGEVGPVGVIQMARKLADVIPVVRQYVDTGRTLKAIKTARDLLRKAY